MLLPALSAARERARSANCVSKLKQIGLANTMYAGDNKDYLTGGRVLAGETHMIGTDYYWGDQRDPYVRLMTGGYFGTAYDIKSGTDFNKYKRPFWQCPSDTINISRLDGESTTYSTSYIWAWSTGRWWHSWIEANMGIGRTILGRHRPSIMVFSDNLVMGADTATNVRNHPNNINILAVGGDVRNMIDNASKTYANGITQFIPRIIDSL